MRKFSILLVLFLFITPGVFASNIILGYGLGNNFTNGFEDDLDIFGSGFIINALLGKKVAFLGHIYLGILPPFKAKLDDVKIDMDDYDVNMLFELLLGVGGNIPVSKSIGLILGGGLHFTIIDFIADSSGNDIFSFNYGLGLELVLNIQFTKTIGLAIGATGAYDFLGISLEDDILFDRVDMARSFAWKAFAGLSLNF